MTFFMLSILMILLSSGESSITAIVGCGGTVSGEWPLVNDILFEVDIPFNTVSVTFSSCNSNFDTALELWDYTQTNMIGSAVGGCVGTGQGQAELTASNLPQNKYYLKLISEAGAAVEGQYELIITCFTLAPRPTTEPTTSNPTTSDPTTADPTTSDPTTADEDEDEDDDEDEDEDDDEDEDEDDDDDDEDVVSNPSSSPITPAPTTSAPSPIACAPTTATRCTDQYFDLKNDILNLSESQSQLILNLKNDILNFGKSQSQLILNLSGIIMDLREDIADLKSKGGGNGSKGFTNDEINDANEVETHNNNNNNNNVGNAVVTAIVVIVIFVTSLILVIFYISRKGDSKCIFSNVNKMEKEINNFYDAKDVANNDGSPTQSL